VSDHKNILDEQLRQALEGLEGNISMSAWDSIEGSLNRSDRRKKFFLYFAIASILVVIGGMGWYFASTNSTSDSPALVEEQSSSNDSENIIQDSERISPPDQVNDNATTEQSGSQTTDKAVDDPDQHPIYTGTPEKVQNQNPENKGGVVDPTNEKTNIGQDPTVTPENKPIVNNEGENSDPKEKVLADSSDSPKTAEPEKELNPIADALPDSIKESKDALPNDQNTITPDDPSSNLANVKGNFEVGLTFNTALLRRIISPNADEAYRLHPRYTDIQNNSLSASRGYVLRLNTLYYINDKTYVSAGLSYTQKEENVRYDFENRFGIHLDLNSRTYDHEAFPLDPLDYETVKFNNTNTYQFAEIPLRIGKIVNLRDKFECRIEAGVSYMLMLSTSGSTIDESYLDLKPLANGQFLKKHMLGAGIKGGVYFTPDNYWRFGLEPGFETSINSIYNKESAVKIKPYNYGLHFTANYLLIKK
jgi:hypothetical protein